MNVLYAPAFDMTVTLDIADTKARRINFNIMDKSFAYMPESQTFFSVDGGGIAGQLVVPSVDGKLKLRFLVDADSVEIFFNDGRASFTEEYGFAYNTKELSLTADGKSRLHMWNSIELTAFGELKRQIDRRTIRYGGFLS